MWLAQRVPNRRCFVCRGGPCVEDVKTLQNLGWKSDWQNNPKAELPPHSIRTRARHHAGGIGCTPARLRTTVLG